MKLSFVLFFSHFLILAEMMFWHGLTTPCCHGYWMTLSSWETREAFCSARRGSTSSATDTVRPTLLFLNVAAYFNQPVDPVNHVYVFVRISFNCTFKSTFAINPIGALSLTFISTHLLKKKLYDFSPPLRVVDWFMWFHLRRVWLKLFSQSQVA